MNFEHLLEPIFNRIRLMVGRCVVLATKYNSGDLEADLELVAGEKRRDVEFLQQYGFSSRPKGNVSGVALFIGGSRDNGVVVATHGDDSDMSANLEPGEVLVHSPFGQTILLKDDGNIELSCGSSSNKIICKNNFEVSGWVHASDDVAATCTPAGTGYSLTNHVHAAAGAIGTPTPPTPTAVAP